MENSLKPHPDKTAGNGGIMRAMLALAVIALCGVAIAVVTGIVPLDAIAEDTARMLGVIAVLALAGLALGALARR